MEKPKLGVALFKSEWFEAIERIETPDVENILTLLRESFDVVFPCEISSMENARIAEREFTSNQVDAVIYIFMMWSDDFPLIHLVRKFRHLPAMVWCFTPYDRLPDSLDIRGLFRGSGSVGFFQGSAPLSKMGLNFELCFGAVTDEDTKAKLKDYSCALSIKKRLESLRIGQLNPRCGCMTGTFVDEFKLRATFGSEVIPLTAYRVLQEAETISDATIKDYITSLKNKYRIIDVSDEALYYSARATLAIEKLVLEEDLGLLAIEDLNEEMHQLLKTRPCLWTERLEERDIVFSEEGDTVSGLCVLLTSLMSGSPCMYSEIFTFDKPENTLVVGHAGIHDIRVAGDNEITIIPDMEYEGIDEVSGAWMRFYGRSGRVTLTSMFSTDKGYRMISFKGTVIDGGSKMDKGFSHVCVKCDRDIAEIYETLARYGVTQHFSVCWSDINDRLEVFCRVMGMEYAGL